MGSIAYSDDLASIMAAEGSPEKAVAMLLESEGVSDEEYRERIITAAQIKQMTGELTEAADLFKKASLSVKGKKDFDSLYRAAILRVETADYRTAEADLRAITTFSDDMSLRVRAYVLASRIKSYQSESDQALDIMSEILKNNEDLPVEAFLWARELAESELSGPVYDDFIDIYENRKIADKAGYDLKNRIPGPDTVFGLIDTGDSESTLISGIPLVIEPEKTTAETVNIAIQIGSFLRMENAEDLKKTVEESGFDAEIRKKSVNGKEYSIVIISVSSENIQPVIMELKEKGFEGYPLY